MHVTELFGLDPKTLSASRDGFSFSHSGLMFNGRFVYRGVQKINLFTLCQFNGACSLYRSFGAWPEIATSALILFLWYEARTSCKVKLYSIATRVVRDK